VSLFNHPLSTAIEIFKNDLEKAGYRLGAVIFNMQNNDFTVEAFWDEELYFEHNKILKD